MSYTMMVWNLHEQISADKNMWSKGIYDNYYWEVPHGNPELSVFPLGRS